MSAVELTAIFRVTAYILALVGIVAWSRNSRQPLDYLGVAVLASGVVIGVLTGYGSSRNLEGIVRMPVTLLICFYVLTRQPGVPALALRKRDIQHARRLTVLEHRAGESEVVADVARRRADRAQVVAEQQEHRNDDTPGHA